MSDDYKGINHEYIDDVQVEECISMDIGFSEEEKAKIKKHLRKKVRKRKNKLYRNIKVAMIALTVISSVAIIFGNSALARVIPTFDEIYRSLGFKESYLPQSVYIGKTYEENGIKVTLENLVGTKQIIKVALKVQYSDEWTREDRDLVHFGCDFEGQENTGSFGGKKDIDENTELLVLNFTSQTGFDSKGGIKIQAFSEAFENPVVWDMKVDFSKNFNEVIARQVTVAREIGTNIKNIEFNLLGAIIDSDTSLNGLKNGDEYYFKIDNKVYPIIGGAWGNEEDTVTLMENISYDIAENFHTISLVKHKNINYQENYSEQMTKEESIKYSQMIQQELDNLSKSEINEVVFTKEITFKNGNKAEIYNIERAGGKIRIYLKGYNKKQVFDMISNLYTSSGQLVENIEDISDGYIAEFDDVSQGIVNIKMTPNILNCKGDYIEEESELILK